jgi:hypothetical protein
METYVAYDNTGEIYATGTTIDVDLQREGIQSEHPDWFVIAVSEAVDGYTQYIDVISQEIKHKSDFNFEIQINKDTKQATISNIPPGTFLRADYNEEIEILDDILELEFNFPGKYNLSFRHAKYIYKEMEIEL